MSLAFPHLQVNWWRLGSFCSFLAARNLRWCRFIHVEKDRAVQAAESPSVPVQLLDPGHHLFTIHKHNGTQTHAEVTWSFGRLPPLAPHELSNNTSFTCFLLYWFSFKVKASCGWTDTHMHCHNNNSNRRNPLRTSTWSRNCMLAKEAHSCAENSPVHLSTIYLFIGCVFCNLSWPCNCPHWKVEILL